MINYYFLITFNKLRIYILRKPKEGSIYKSVEVNLCYPIPTSPPPFFYYQNVWTIDKCEGYLLLTTKNKRGQTKQERAGLKKQRV